MSQGKRSTIEEMKERAKNRGGECLSEKYVNTHTKLIWRCKKGHIWESAAHSIKKGHWCPICRGEADPCKYKINKNIIKYGDWVI